MNGKFYEVFWVAGDRDGETLGTFEDEYDAIKFACKFWDEHEEEFDPVCGGVAINASDGEEVNW